MRFHDFPAVETSNTYSLLNILHSNHGVVPRKVTLKTLVQIGIIIGYYFIPNDAVALYTNPWTKQLNKVRKTDPPPPNSAEGMKWLFVSFVFNQNELFQEPSFRFIHAFPASVDDFSLPMVPVLAKIDTCRQKIIQNEFDRLLQPQSDLVVPPCLRKSMYGSTCCYFSIDVNKKCDSHQTLSKLPMDLVFTA